MACDVRDWLRGQLADGPVPAAELLQAAAAAGIARRTLFRAARAVGLTSVRSGFPAAATWSLPGGTTGGPSFGTTAPEPSCAACCARCRFLHSIRVCTAEPLAAGWPLSDARAAGLRKLSAGWIEAPRQCPAYQAARP